MMAAPPAISSSMNSSPAAGLKLTASQTTACRTVQRPKPGTGVTPLRGEENVCVFPVFCKAKQQPAISSMDTATWPRVPLVGHWTRP
ncbi:MAG: hypothetical protein N2D54_02360 [Chloroflexota bacterium]